MGYKKKIEEAKRKAQIYSIAIKILDLMDKLRLDANENAQRRWIWELLQNAKDVAFDNERLAIEVNIQVRNGQKSVSFSHNGKPFSVDEITFLIEQVSTKERTANANNEKPSTTGKFGTGFLTTHLLSEKVEVIGVIKEIDLDYKRFVLPLDRSGRTPEQIIESVNKSISVIDTLDDQPSLPNFNPDEFNTTFKYSLDEEGYRVAKVGIEDLHLSLPFTLAFLPSIESVTVKHESITYELAKIENESSHIQIATILKKTTSGAKEIKIVMLSKNTTTIAIEIEKINGEIYVKAFPDDLPKLFCNFPLIGTNDFSLPIVINSFAFNPTEPRDGIWLTDHSNDPKILENKQIFIEAMELYFDLLTYASKSGWKNLFYLARTDMPREKKWFSKSWFEANFQKPIREKILTTPIVDLVDERRVSFNLEGGGFVDFPYHSKKEIRERIWELCNIGKYFLLPKREEIHEWYDVIWDKKYYLTLESIISWIDSHKDLDTLSQSLGKNQEQSIEWLNQFYELINLDEDAINLINQDKYAVILNQNNYFKKKGELYVDKDIEEELKNALIILDKDWRDILVHKKIGTISKILYPVKRQEDIIYEINKIIKECKSENISESCDYLSSCFADDRDFPKEQEKIYEFSQAFREMPQKRNIKNWDKSIWQEVNKLQIKWLIQTISECKSIEKLQERLKLEKQDTLEWLNSFIDFLINNGYEDRLNLKTSPILPNQNGNFCIKDDLFLDNGEIEEILKDILESLGYELREELLDMSIYLELPKNRERNQKFVADEITKLITPKFAEFPRADETKQIFKSLYLWFNKNKALAESIFHSLYANRHKLYDDEEVAANMQKAEELDNIMQEFGISDLGELREALKAGIGTKPQKKEIKDRSELIAVAVTSETVAKEMNKASKILHLEVINFSSADWDYVNRIISRAVKRVLEYLSQNPRYKFSNDIDVLMGSAQPKTVITGVFKDGQPINLVIRPSDGQKIHVYYGLEFEKLLLENTELWIENGIEDPELLTIGKILRYTETEIIPLYPNRLR
ncbi:MAG: hypothetical protein ABIM30_08775 [candidate division WOR-3 bacterium]